MTDLTTCVEAGSRGGTRTAALYGPAHYARLRAARGALEAGTQRRVSLLGGAATRDRYGVGYLREIGKRGGDVLLAHRGKEWFSELGHKGAAARMAHRAGRAPT